LIGIIIRRLNWVSSLVLIAALPTVFLFITWRNLQWYNMYSVLYDSKCQQKMLMLGINKTCGWWCRQLGGLYAKITNDLDLIFLGGWDLLASLFSLQSRFRLWRYF
jgi:hypothetical protein